jgi:hypothetical protein
LPLCCLVIYLFVDCGIFIYALVMEKDTASSLDTAKTSSGDAPLEDTPSDTATEHGGPKAPEPTRYGDWEKGGRCTDF